MARAGKKQELKICFDTNVLYTQVASDLLKRQVADLLSEPIKDPNLSVKWYLPQMVRDEREYQMKQKAIELLPTLAKLERVIGHALGITPEIIKDRIANTIKQQVEQFGLQILPLTANDVDWTSLISASVMRTAPFEAGEKEKGFRDAVIVETFLQEVKRSPKTVASCVLALVSEDGLVREAARARTAGASNVRVLSDLDELKSLINTLASEVSEDYVAAMQKKAAPLFWTELNDKNTCCYLWEIDKAIRDVFKDVLEKKPEGVSRIALKGVFVATTPQFVSKDGPIIHWQSRIRYVQDLYGPSTVNKLAGLLNTAPIVAQGGLLGLSQSALPEPPLNTRESLFYVRWSTRVNTKQGLSTPKLVEIVETDLQPPKDSSEAI